MADAKKSGIKSAFDLAMERMAAKGETLQTLSGEQKDAIAELTRRTTAKVAETEMAFKKRREGLNPEADAEKLRTIDDQQAAELRKLRAKEAEEKARIRDGQ